jgi:hypothetical protein
MSSLDEVANAPREFGVGTHGKIGLLLTGRR